MAAKILADEVKEVVPYVQRRITTPTVNRGGDTLHALLFHPIAGDSLAVDHQHAAPAAELSELLALRHLQFGILDTRTIDELAVVTVTNPACTDTPGALADSRMGASPGRTGACQTCGQQHHNCPDQATIGPIGPMVPGLGHFGRILLPHPVVNPLFVTLLTAVLQTTCMNCHRLRLSPLYVSTMLPGRARQLQRIKAIGLLCVRQAQCLCAGIDAGMPAQSRVSSAMRPRSGNNRCSDCFLSTLVFKQQGICITARRTDTPTGSYVIVPASVIFASLVRLTEADLGALGFGGSVNSNHPCNAVLSVLPVLPPVSRPAMRTMNLAWGWTRSHPRPRRRGIRS
jgi:DNA-directed RNA polymerase beta' subunit